MIAGLSLGRSWWDTAVFLAPQADRVYLTSRVGRVLQIPSRILVASPSYRVIAYGAQARQVEYAGVEESKILSPFSERSITDEVGARLLLRALMWEVLGTRYLLKPVIHVALPPSITPFMRELWQRALYSSGARRVQAWHPALAAAAAAGLPYDTAQGFAVGWATNEEVVICLLAFGQVQKEVRSVRRWKSAVGNPKPEEVGTLWQEFLRSVPAEFVPGLQSTGLLLVTEDSPAPGQTRQWAKAAQAPVTFFPWSNIPLGLRKLAQEEA